MAVVAGCLTIMVVMLLSVVERRREFGILKAVGWTPGNIAMMVLVESVFLSLVGAILGVALGWAGLVGAKGYLGLDIGALDLRVARGLRLRRAGGGCRGRLPGLAGQPGCAGGNPAWIIDGGIRTEG